MTAHEGQWGLQGGGFPAAAMHRCRQSGIKILRIDVKSANLSGGDSQRLDGFLMEGVAKFS
jgi:hypothetical protein